MISRRNFLKYSTGILATVVSPATLARMASAEERALQLQSIHTGEKTNTIYWANGGYVQENLTELDHLLRDHRTGQVTMMDRELYDLLFALQLEVGNMGRYQVISGYRSPKTNAMLRKTSNGVAKRSLHTQGKAIDIRLPGTDLKHLRQAALNLKAGGVGYYPRSNFIHVDTGRPRFW